MNDITVSLFDHGDIPSLVEIENESFSFPFKEQDFINLYESNFSNVLVAKKDNVVLGYVSFMVLVDECQILNFATKNEFKRQGVAKSVMDALLEYCKNSRICKIFLEVRVSNEAAIALYEKYGFSSVGISKNHFSSPREDAILMNLEL